MKVPTDTTEGQALAALFDKATDILTSYVVPLYENHNGRPYLFGSGFFVRAGTACFLVSAAHVLETIRTRPLFYYITPTTIQELTGQLRVNRWHGDRNKDSIDTAVLKLAGRLPPYPEVNKAAMDISGLSPRLLPRANKIYAIIGFPASRSKVVTATKQVTAAAYAYRDRSVSDQEYSVHGLSPETHIVLPLNLKQGVDSNGRHRTFPKPQGMSGSPIWLLVDENESGEPGAFTVVGLGTEYRNTGRVLIGTDIEVARRMIQRAI